ncbi:MAG: hypothetical protein RLZZ449_1440, partial [Actinomycetota bacterium]
MTDERGLTALDGVAATVNFAAESARVSIANPSITSERLISVVEGLGYGARLLEDTTPDMLDAEVREKVTALKIRLTASAILALPVFIVSMFTQLQFT